MSVVFIVVTTVRLEFGATLVFCRPISSSMGTLSVAACHAVLAVV